MFKRMKWVAQVLMGDRRNICEYRDQDHVPFVIQKPIKSLEITSYLDKGVLVTFAVQVPLSVIMAQSSTDDGAVESYIIQNWFEDKNIQLSSAEFRAIGASFEEFDDAASGLVHLQVTCSLTSWNF